MSTAWPRRAIDGVHAEARRRGDAVRLVRRGRSQFRLDYKPVEKDRFALAGTTPRRLRASARTDPSPFPPSWPTRGQLQSIRRGGASEGGLMSMKNPSAMLCMVPLPEKSRGGF
jgi:hypothetical protein